MQRGVIDKKPVFVFAVLPQRLAVVAEQQNRRGLEAVQLLQPGEYAAQLRVVKCDLTVIGMACILAQIGLRRPVRTVRIVEVQPDEEGRVALLI